MLLNLIYVLSALSAAGICAAADGFSSLAWLWILPLTFADPRDYDAIEPDTQLYIYNIEEGMKQGSLTVTDQVHGFHFTVKCDMTDRQRAIVMAGGLLNYTKEGGK